MLASSPPHNRSDRQRTAPRLTGPGLRTGAAWVSQAWWVAIVCALAGWLCAPTLGWQGGDPAARTGATGSVDIDVLQFGSGDVCRPGEWVGVQLALQDRTTKLRSLIVRLAITDADGDPAWCQVVQPANAGQKVRVWLYGRLPFSTTTSTVFQISAFEGEDSGDGVIRQGRLVGSLAYPIKPASLAPAYCSLMGVVGRQTVSLERYTVRTNSGMGAMPLGHELVYSIPSLRPGQKGQPGELPDRWYGLSQFDAIVWTASGTDGEPSDLVPSQAEALREWVERGGHLVVMLSSVSQNWLTTSANPLTPILPRCTAARLEHVDMEPMRSLLMGPGKDPASRSLPADQTIYALVPDPAADAGQATRILNDPEGRCIVARRNVGVGAVTVVGLDLAARGFLQRGGIEPDAFWHRVLGRRGTLIRAEDLPSLAAKSGVFVDSRSPRWYDRSIPGLIAKSESGGFGVLLAFIVFLAYWVLAGPLGFAILKRRNWSQHAWVGFMVTGAIFTAIAWGGATALRPLTVSASHVTILDHVYGQKIDRARTFLSVLLPRYGDVPISVSSEAENTLKQGLFSFDAPTDGNTSSSSFPDSRGYIVDARHPAQAQVPARSTTKDFQIDWAGGPAWKMPSPVVEVSKGRFEPGGAITVVDPSLKTSLLTGLLSHSLPGPLHDVDIIYVQGQDLARDTRGRFIGSVVPGALPGTAYAAFRQTWSAGEILDLAEDFAANRDSVKQPFSSFMQRLAPGVRDLEMDLDPRRVVDSAAQVTNYLTALAFLPMLEPPSFSSNAAFTSGGPTLARRRMTHGMDLSRWFTQPCLIIVGHLGDSTTAETCPVPITVDGESPASLNRRITGRTVLRWVYPLPDRPPKFEQKDAAEPEMKP